MRKWTNLSGDWKKNPSTIIEVFMSLSPADRTALNARVERQAAEATAKSQKKIQQRFEQWEKDGSMDKIRKPHAED
jgi:hypothetical protein